MVLAFFAATKARITCCTFRPPDRELREHGWSVPDRRDQRVWHDLATNDRARVDFAKRHPDQVEHADFGTGQLRLNPQAKVAGKDDAQKQDKEQHHRDSDDQPNRSWRNLSLSKQMLVESLLWFLKVMTDRRLGLG